MRLFKNTWFNRFAKKEGITDDELREKEYKALAKKYLNLSDEIIEKAVQLGKFIEI